MDTESKREIDRLRSQARRESIAIRTRRAPGAHATPVFSLIDRHTGAVLRADITDVGDLETQLTAVVTGRGSAPTGPPSVREVPEVRCPTCGTRRMAQFRWCRTCGLDFEAYKVPASDVSAAGSEAGASPADDDQPAEGSDPAHPPGMTRRARLADAVWELYLFGPWRQILGVGLAAVFAGVLVTVLINAMR